MLGSHVRAFVQLNLTHANRDAESVSPVDDTGTEVLQGFVDMSFPTGSAGESTVRAGRQVMAYGSERLVSMRYGPNVLRTFDGGLASWQSMRLRMDTFSCGQSATAWIRSTTAPMAIAASGESTAPALNPAAWRAPAGRLLPRAVQRQRELQPGQRPGDAQHDGCSLLRQAIGLELGPGRFLPIWQLRRSPGPGVVGGQRRALHLPGCAASSAAGHEGQRHQRRPRSERP